MSIPSAIPKGVESEKASINQTALFFCASELKCLLKEMPRDIDAGPLCKISPSIIFMVEAKSAVKPKAIPSKILCVDRASRSTKDFIALQEQLHFRLFLFFFVGSMAD